MKKKDEDLNQNIVIAEIKKDICYIKESLAAIHQMFDRGDQRYALKWVEKVMIGMIGLILVAVVGALMTLIIK